MVTLKLPQSDYLPLTIVRSECYGYVNYSMSGVCGESSLCSPMHTLGVQVYYTYGVGNHSVCQQVGLW